MRLGIMGPQGSGKSTQSKLLGEKLSLCVVDTGQLIRDRGNLDDSVGKSIQAAMLSGNLVENQIPAEILENRLGELDCQNGFVVDGYPRSLEQLEDFDPKYERVFYLDI